MSINMIYMIIETKLDLLQIRKRKRNVLNINDLDKDKKYSNVLLTSKWKKYSDDFFSNFCSNSLAIFLKLLKIKSRVRRIIIHDYFIEFH